VSTVELLAERAQLPLLELADRDASPPFGRAKHRRVHQREHGPLPKGMRHDPGPAPLEQIGGADDLGVDGSTS